MQSITLLILCVAFQIVYSGVTNPDEATVIYLFDLRSYSYIYRCNYDIDPNSMPTIDCWEHKDKWNYRNKVVKPNPNKPNTNVYVSAPLDTQNTDIINDPKCCQDAYNKGLDTDCPHCFKTTSQIKKQCGVLMNAVYKDSPQGGTTYESGTVWGYCNACVVQDCTTECQNGQVCVVFCVLLYCPNPVLI